MIIKQDMSLSDFFDKKIDEDKAIKAFDKIFEMFEKNAIHEPVAYQRYKLREKYVEKALIKKSVCKVFFLIANGTNYNEAIAEEYYGKKAKFHDPKVTSIYLKELRNAGIIKRGERDGRKQIYEVDWQGLFDILLFRDIFSHPAKKTFGMTHFFYQHIPSGSSTDANDKIDYWTPSICFIRLKLIEKEIFNEKQIEKIIEKICFKFFKPYVEEYVSSKLSKKYTRINEPFPYLELTYPRDDKGNLIKDIELVDCDILEILNDFDVEFTEKFPTVFENNFKEILTHQGTKDIPDFLKYIILSYDTGNKYAEKMEYKKSGIPNPKNKLKNAFMEEFQKVGIDFDNGK